MRSIMKSRTKILFLAMGIIVSTSSAQTFTYAGGTGCENPLVATDFKKTTLVDMIKDPTLWEPVKMAIATDGRIFFVERVSDHIGETVTPQANARVKLYTPTTGAVTTIADIAITVSMKEMGMTGIALDPNFDTNHWVYLFYSPEYNGQAVDKAFRVSRLAYNGTVLDKTTEKVLLSIPFQTDACCHTAGAMQFDGKGNLWVAVGNNTDNNKYYVAVNSKKATLSLDTLPIGDDQAHAANTNDLRGKILRIHPEQDGSYTIPDGNLFPQSVAANVGKTKPEIYSMGHRNPYSLFVDKYPTWPLYAWGDVGPDYGGLTEELNLKSAPGFMGWPYFAGTVGNPQYKFAMYSLSHLLPKPIDAVAADYDMDPLAPINNSINNTGLKILPPAQDATFGYEQSTAMTGPVYHYDGKLASSIKFPPHFNKMWFMADHNKSWLKVAPVDSTGKVGKQTQLWTALNFATPTNVQTHPIDLEFGPDGALYVIEYGGYFKANENTKIIRIEYTGTCTDPNLLPPTMTVGILDKHQMLPTLGKNSMLSNLTAGTSLLLAPAAKGFELFNLQGQKVWEFTRQNAEQNDIAIPVTVEKGILQVKVF
jgi:cytochrome c